MSWDVRLCDPVTKEELEVSEPHHVRGGTYQLGGTQHLWLNITYNYGSTLERVLGEDGIRSLYGKTGAETIPILEKAISELHDDVSEDYWEETDGNVKRSLYGLLSFAKMRPDGVWDGD